MKILQTECKWLDLGIWNFNYAMVVGFFISFVLGTGKSSEFNELNGFCFIASFDVKAKHLETISLA